MNYISRQYARHPHIFSLIAVAAAFIFFYIGTNHLSAFTPHYLPLFTFENLIPFIPWTVIIYLSTFPLIAASILLIKPEDLKKTVNALIAVIIALAFVFLFFPTTYPRPPLPADAVYLNRILYGLLIKVDTPKNCFPSLHVTATVFVTLVLARRSRRLGAWFAIWTLTIIISTLTLKQHYLLDGIAGIFLGYIFYWLYFLRKK